MKYSIAFDSSWNRFTLTTFEAVSMKGVKQMLRDLLMHPSWKKGRDLLVDHRKASFSQISSEEMAFLADTVVALDEKLGARFCAVISPDDGITKHAMYKFDVDPRADLVTRVFMADEYDAALEWLGFRATHQRETA
ncbi:MAG: hypothetical protein JXX14_07345 [Deltaproteobacteria bacterium]|nr:hypothetical protein [Deltaproteobacteria bacterium]